MFTSSPGEENIDNSSDSSPIELIQSSADSSSIPTMEVAPTLIEANEPNIDQENAENAGYGKRVRKKVSKIWDEFEEVKVGHIVQQIKCKHCKLLFKLSKTGTTTQYKRHLDTCPKRVNVNYGQP